MRRILALLSPCPVRATFFVLGWVAERRPEIVHEMAEGGHESATHGYWHELIDRQPAEEFVRDLGQSLEAIARALRGSSHAHPFWERMAYAGGETCPELTESTR